METDSEDLLEEEWEEAEIWEIIESTTEVETEITEITKKSIIPQVRTAEKEEVIVEAEVEVEGKIDQGKKVTECMIGEKTIQKVRALIGRKETEKEKSGEEDTLHIPILLQVKAEILVVDKK